MIGLILLAGIVVNNGIVMIDYIKVLQARGVERAEAVIRGASRRLRPILMTAATTILSMVPLALEIGCRIGDLEPDGTHRNRGSYHVNGPHVAGCTLSVLSG